MPYLSAKEVRAMTPEQRKENLLKLRGDLLHERGIADMGGAPTSPGKIAHMRRTVARILTIMKEKGEVRE